MTATIDDGPDVRVSIGVVAFGVTERLLACLDSLRRHESSTSFAITCVVNPSGQGSEPIDQIGSGVRVVTPPTNLGWAGGLHAARAVAPATAEYFVWVQDDMRVADGWLDALLAAADAHRDAAAFGSVGVDDAGRPVLFSAGMAEPADRMDLWNDTDRTPESLPSAPSRFDWVTSKGLLTRLDAWDEIGGTDPTLFPLNHVDKVYCAHLRCHGWQVMLVPDARLHHAGNRSAPGPMRTFLVGWRSAILDARWGGPLQKLGTGNAASVDHECAPWRLVQGDALSAEIERIVGLEAARMLVPFNTSARELRDQLQAQLADLHEQHAQLEAEFAARAEATAKQTAALKARRAELKSRVRMLRRRARSAESRVAALERSSSWRITRPLRAVSRGLRRTR